jgi:hypothetical protein
VKQHNDSAHRMMNVHMNGGRYASLLKRDDSDILERGIGNELSQLPMVS